MISYSLYRVLHISAALALFISIGAVLFHALNGNKDKTKAHKWPMITHGIAMLVLIVAGFGLLAKTGLIRHMQSWIYFKIALWFVFGFATLFARRFAKHGKILWLVFITLGVIVVSLVEYRPNFLNSGHNPEPAAHQEMPHDHNHGGFIEQSTESHGGHGHDHGGHGHDHDH